jgi:hypothetical protein
MLSRLKNADGASEATSQVDVNELGPVRGWLSFSHGQKNSEQEARSLRTTLRYLLYFRPFGFGGDEDRDIGVGVFPKREESVVLGAGFVGVARKRQGTRELGVGQGDDRAVEDEARVVQNFLKLGGGFAALAILQVSFSAHVN